MAPTEPNSCLSKPRTLATAPVDDSTGTALEETGNQRRIVLVQEAPPQGLCRAKGGGSAAKEDREEGRCKPAPLEEKGEAMVIASVFFMFAFNMSFYFPRPTPRQVQCG